MHIQGCVLLQSHRCASVQRSCNQRSMSHAVGAAHSPQTPLCQQTWTWLSPAFACRRSTRVWQVRGSQVRTSSSPHCFVPVLRPARTLSRTHQTVSEIMSTAIFGFAAAIPEAAAAGDCSLRASLLPVAVARARIKEAVVHLVAWQHRAGYTIKSSNRHNSYVHPRPTVGCSQVSSMT